MDSKINSIYRSSNTCKNIPLHFHPRPIVKNIDGSSSNSGSENTTIITVGGGSGGIGDELVGMTLIDTINLNANNITANQISTAILNVTTISSFTTSVESDVTFLGSTSDNKIFWDSSENTLHVDGKLNISDSSLTLNCDPDVGTLTSSDNEDKGFFFKWYDGSEKLGFMGFDISTQRFKVYTDTNVTAGAITSGDLGNYEMTTLYTNEIKNRTGNDLDIIIDSNDFFNGITNGSYSVLVSGTGTDTLTLTNDASSINLVSSYNDPQAIYLNANSGGIEIFAEDNLTVTSNTGSILNTVLTDFNINVNSSGNILNFDETDGLVIQNPKTDYKKWFSYKKFNFISGIWVSIREESTGQPFYYWKKDAAAETVRLMIDLTDVIRETSSKGMSISNIYVSYEVETDTLNSVSSKITKQTFSKITHDYVLADVPITNINLTAGTTVSKHFRGFSITTPSFINDDSIYTMELSFDTQVTSILKFHGSMCYFEYNHF